MSLDRNKFRAELESLGPARVREILSYSPPMPFSRIIHTVNFMFDDGRAIAEAWLKEKELLEAKNDRAVEFQIAKEANDIARKSNHIAWFAVAVSAISLIASAFAIWRT